MSRDLAASHRRSSPPSARLVVLLSLLAVLLAAGARRCLQGQSIYGAQDTAYQLTWQGLRRFWIVHLPRGYDGSRPLPVVFMFHGFGGTAGWSLRLSGWSEKADDQQFIAVFPEGSRPHPEHPVDPETNAPSWNDGSGRFSSCWDNIDDVGLTLAILQDVSARYPVDASRVYAVGFSNGSSFVYRLGIEASSTFAALGVVSSSGIRVPVSPTGEVGSLIATHGTADAMSPIEGGAVRQFGIIDRRPAPIVAARTWAGLLGLSPQARESDPGEGIHLWQFGPGANGGEVRFYQLAGRGHVYPRSRTLRGLGRGEHDEFDATDVMWEFFRTHPRSPAAEPRPQAKAAEAE